MGLKWISSAVALWQKAQVEFHGQYSLERLTRFAEYSRQTCWQRVIVLMLVSPLPCLVAIVAFELIELQPPEAGASANWGFWLRLFGSNWLMTLICILNFHQALGIPPLNMLLVICLTLLTNVLPLIFVYELGTLIGFPVPFVLHVILVPWLPGVVVITAIIFKPYLHHSASLKPKAIEFSKIYSIPGGMTIIYPIYFYIFRQLDSSYQGVFSLALPTTKIALKNIMSSFFRINSDMRPETIVFTIEVFASLFATFSLQSSSIQPIILLTSIDIAQACVSLFDILSYASELKRSKKGLQSLQTTHDTTKSIDDLIRDASEIALGLNEDSRQQIESIVSRQVGFPTRILPENFIPQAKTTVGKEISARPIQVLPKLPLPKYFSRHGSTLKISQSSGPCKLFPNPSSNAIAYHKQVVVLQVLSFLHATEYIVLVEFIKVVIPIIYALYLSVAFQLPNHEFYPQFHEVNKQQQQELMTSILIYAIVELTAFTTVGFIVWWRLHFSLLKQLAFVLDSQWRYIQMRLVLWVLYVIQCSLVHFGVDYSFRFKWLHHTSS